MERPYVKSKVLRAVLPRRVQYYIHVSKDDPKRLGFLWFVLVHAPLVNLCLRAISAPWIPYTRRFSNEVILPFVESRWYHLEG